MNEGTTIPCQELQSVVKFDASSSMFSPCQKERTFIIDECYSRAAYFFAVQSRFGGRLHLRITYEALFAALIKLALDGCFLISRTTLRNCVQLLLLARLNENAPLYMAGIDPRLKTGSLAFSGCL